MKIHELIQERERVKTLSEVVEESVPYKLRAGAGVQIAAATQRLQEIDDQILARTVPERLIAVFANFPKTETPSTALEDLYGFVTTNSITIFPKTMFVQFARELEYSFAQPISDIVEKDVHARPKFSTVQYSLLKNHLQAACLFYNVPEFDFEFQERECLSFDALANIVTDTILSTDGGRILLTARVKTDILAQVVTKSLLDRRVPVFVFGDDRQLIRDTIKPLFNKTIDHTFNPEFAATKDNITKILKEAKETNHDHE